AMSITVGKAIGQGRHIKAARIATESLMLSLLLTILLCAVGYFLTDSLFAKLGATPSTIVLIRQYMDIWFGFAVLLAMPMICKAAIRATGDTKWPSILMMVSGLVNVVLDPILIFGFGPIPAMGMAGAAWATAAAWLFASVAAIYLLSVREKLLVLKLPPVGELFHVWRDVLTLAGPICLANMLGPMSIGALTAIVARYGESSVAAFGVGGRVEAFSLVVAFAVTAALSPYLSQNLGAGNGERARTAVRNSTRFIFIFQLAVWGLLAAFAPSLAGIFSDDPAVIGVAIYYLRIMPLAVVCYAVIIVINTAFNAYHQSGKTLALSLLRVVVFVIPLAWLGAWKLGLAGVFMGAILGSVLSLIAVIFTYGRMVKRTSTEAGE
ncbi:MAG: MATE family efflux transporter, partial [Gammaproteobacteria bacterium]